MPLGLDPRVLERGEPFAELMHPSDPLRAPSAEVERHAILGRDRFRQEYAPAAGDGWRWVEDHTWIERGADGVPVAYNGVLLDVTDRKQAELGLELVASTVPALLENEPLSPLIQRVLERLGMGMGADRVYIFEMHGSAQSAELLASQRYEWCQEDIETQIANPELQNLPFAALFPRWLQMLRADSAVAGAVSEFPVEERALLQAQQIQSLIVVPVNLRGILWDSSDSGRGPQRVRHWTSAEERVPHRPRRRWGRPSSRSAWSRPCAKASSATDGA